MTSATAVFKSAPDLSPDDYVVVGLATCFVREEGEVSQVTVAEPVPSAYLEALFKGVPTSYQSLHAVTLGEVVSDEQPQMIPGAAKNTDFCPEFISRIFAAARTYKSRPEAQALVPVGSTKTDINHSTERKRVLNAEHIVRTEDNVKQHEYTHKVL